MWTNSRQHFVDVVDIKSANIHNNICTTSVQHANNIWHVVEMLSISAKMGHEVHGNQNAWKNHAFGGSRPGLVKELGQKYDFDFS